jgi:hypothetical protein
MRRCVKMSCTGLAAIFKKFLDRNKSWNDKDVPVVGKVYHMFDDGKITLQRHYLVKCLEVIPFEKFSTDTAYADLFKCWQKNVQDCDWVYCVTTDYIVKCQIVGDRDNRILYYTRMSDGSSEAVHVVHRDTQTWQWFGFGSLLYDGVLDVTGKIWEQFYDNYKMLM